MFKGGDGNMMAKRRNARKHAKGHKRSCQYEVLKVKRVLVLWKLFMTGRS